MTNRVALTIRTGDIEVHIPQDFQWFDPAKPVRIYTRNLPHWRQEGATYFVTFRLADSIPRAVWLDMRREARDWAGRIALAMKHNDGHIPDALHLQWEAFQKRHMTRLESILDSCQGSCILRDHACREIVADSLRRFDGERHQMRGFVIMPNHVHLAVTPLPGFELEDLLQGWKTFTAREIHLRTGSSAPLWQKESYDRIVRDAEHFVQVMRYLVNNPRKAKLPMGTYTLETKCAVKMAEPTDTSALHEDTPEYGSDHPLVW